MKYTILLLDARDEVLASNDADTKKEAISRAKYLLSADYARSCETTHEELGTHKVEVRTFDGYYRCVWDMFVA